MGNAPLSAEDVSALINHLLEARDPAIVGLRRILKRKTQAGQGFPLQELSLDEFGMEDGSGSVFDEAERRILEIEKRTVELEAELAKTRQDAEGAIQGAGEQGLRDGIQQGEKTGEERARARYDERLEKVEERFAALLEDMVVSRRAMILDSERILIELAKLVARKVINTELSLNPRIIVNTIHQALSHIADREELVVRVAPQDMEAATGKQEFWAGVADRLQGVSVEKDSRISRGGCVVESRAGTVDARIEVKLAKLAEVVETTWQSVTAAERSKAEAADSPCADETGEGPENASSPSPDTEPSKKHSEEAGEEEPRQE